MNHRDLIFAENPVLFGSGTTERIVAVEPVGGDHMRLYSRDGTRDVPFQPYLWLSSEDPLKDCKVPYRMEPLAGDALYRVLAVFNSWFDLMAARKVVMKANRKAEVSNHMFVNDPVQQFLMASGETLFRGMRLPELVRLQLDVRLEQGAIEASVSSTQGHDYVLAGDEKSVLEHLNHIVAAVDPDVIEGHNLSTMDMRYLIERGRHHGAPLKWGRDGSEPEVAQSRVQFAERVVDYVKWSVYGRHVVDTWLLVQFADISSRDMDGYGLDDATRYFGISAEKDVHRVRGVSDILSGSYFLQAQMLPYSYQNTVVRGNATKINALFLREYLRRRRSIPPAPEDFEAYEGGYTDMFEEGVLQNVVHCDVQSLYPSLMLANQIAPRNESLGIFLPLLSDIKDFRLKAKALAAAAANEEDRHHYTALQQTFKILINSFYGYLGTTFSNFADSQAAADVTRRGRDLIRQVIEDLKALGCRPVEIDTDGVYFVPPPGQDGAALVQALSQKLPAGIVLEADARYPAMFSYKTKNYALLEESGNVVIKGSGLKSRGIERYLRDFMQDVITLLLKGRTAEIDALYQSYVDRLASRAFDIRMLSKTETLSESLSNYRDKVQQKKRNAAAAYELALQSGRSYQPGDQITYYVTGTSKKVRILDHCKLVRDWNPASPDDNVEYYQEKLRELAERFVAWLPAGSKLRQSIESKATRPKRGTATGQLELEGALS